MSYDKLKKSEFLRKHLASYIHGRQVQNEIVLKGLDNQRKRNHYFDSSLFQFGIELYENNYNLDDFKTDIELCSGYIDQISEGKLPKEGAFTYEGCAHAPSLDKILKIIEDPGFFTPVQTGYEVARRRDNIKRNNEKSK